MKLTELLVNQRTTIQLLWGEQKIEFFSIVVDNDGVAVYVTPYVHNGSPLDINIVPGKGVVCNIFTNNPMNNQRISWKNIELETLTRKGETVYCLKARGYNNVAKHDDRRLHERVLAQVKGMAFDPQSNVETNVVIHDISDIGISFYAPATFAPKSNQLTITFTDNVEGRQFNVKTVGTITRTVNRDGNIFVGCRVMGENKDYQIYTFIKRLRNKNTKEATE